MAFKINVRQAHITFTKAFGVEKQRELFARAAYQLLDEGLERNERILGERPSYRQFVDGAEGRAFEDVKIGGEIRVVYNIEFAVAQAIVQLLYQSSPYDPTPDGKPHYRDTHRVVVDDVIVDPPFADIGFFERMLIINDRPYANFLEARYAIYESLVFPHARRLFGRAFRVDLVRDEYFGDRNLGILVRPR